MRRVATLFGGVAFAASLLAAPVSAAPPVRVSDTESVLFCENLANADGVAFVFAVESAQFGSFADLAFWPAGTSPEMSEPAWIAMTGSADFGPTSVTATFELVEYEPSPTPDEPPFGDPVGTATLNGTLTAVGDPQSYRSQEKNGNQQFRREGVFQEYSVTGSLELPGGIVFDLGSCTAVTDAYTEFTTMPAAHVSRFDQLTLDCFWEVGETTIGLFAFAEEFGGFTGMFVSGPDTELEGVLAAPETFTTESFEATYDLFDLTDSEAGDPVGSATASATLTEGGRINERFAGRGFKTMIRGTSYVVDGTLSLDLPSGPLSLPMDEASCTAADVTVTDIVTPSRGPRGRPLPNDAPDAAAPIGIGDTITVRTGGTDPEPEAGCLVETPEGTFDVPISHTAWWTFEGTGGDVTVDTAGSNFDTAIGVYADVGGELVQVACVDDTGESLQAAATIATDAGVTYYVQAGGFGGSFGTLVLTVE
jgi:hypothetical protein